MRIKHRSLHLLTFFAGFILFVTSVSSKAAELQFKSVHLNGVTVEYGISLPKNYTQEKTYPVILSVPPGSQTKSMAEAGLENWLTDFANEGYIVITPVKPSHGMFFRGGEKIIPAFLGYVVKQLHVQENKFYLLGISNGGISAFRIGTLYPSWFKSLTIIPGYPTSEDQKRLENLKVFPVNLLVGSKDSGWFEASKRTHTALIKLGVNSELKVFEGENHFMHSRMPAHTVLQYIQRGL